MVSTTTPPYKNNSLKELHIFPDSETSIYTSSWTYFLTNAAYKKLILYHVTEIKAVDCPILTSHWMLPVKLDFGSQTAIQNIYICDRVNRVYFSKAGGKESRAISLCFPHPMPYQPDTIAAVDNTDVESPTKAKSTPTIQPKPQTLPYSATEANLPKLEQYLKDAFKGTAFNR